MARTIRVWPEVGDHGETRWCAGHPAGLIETNSKEAAIEGALKAMKRYGFSTEEVEIISGRYVRVWVEDEKLVAERIEAGQLDDEIAEINAAIIKRWSVLRAETYERLGEPRS